MRRRTFLVMMRILLTCVIGLALVPSLGWADEGSTQGQTTTETQTDTAALVLVSDEEAVVKNEAPKEGGRQAEDTTEKKPEPIDDPDSLVLVQDDDEQRVEEPALVTQGTVIADDLVVDDELQEDAMGDGRGLQVQASSTTLESLLDAATLPTVLYRTHVQTYGWQEFQSNGAMSGTTGESKRLEAIQIGVKVPGVSGGICYKVHRQTYGWEKAWKKNGDESGTTGESKRLEGIRIKLTGKLAKQFDVVYRVHVQTYGWQQWKKNGEVAGTTGESKRLEGIEIRLVAKASGDSAKNKTLESVAGSLVNYNAYVQASGWTTTVADGATAGTIGEGKRLEGIQIKLGPDVRGGIEYRTHIQTNGWETDWKANGALSGAPGDSKRLEAIRIRLTGEAAKNYDVWYRVQVQTYGWLGWATNGESAGTSRRAKRLEAIEIRLLPKGSAAPGTTLRHYIQKSLIYLDAGHGLSGDGWFDVGALGSGYREADLTKELVNKVASYTKKRYGITVYNNVDCDVHYTKRQLHAQSMGATAYVSVHFNAASSAATGFESFIFEAEPGYPGMAAPRSDELQRIMHPRLVKALGLMDRGEKTAAFSVVNGIKTGIPATLVEVCFVTNAQDMITYQSKKAAVVRAIAAGLNEATQAGF